MENTTLEHYLAHYCAATLLGEKSASLVSLPREECARIGLQLREYNRQLDVLAFVATGGAGCKLCGYWKVYHNVEAARACFARYDACRDRLCRAIAQGTTISQLLCAA